MQLYHQICNEGQNHDTKKKNHFKSISNKKTLIFHKSSNSNQNPTKTKTKQKKKHKTCLYIMQYKPHTAIIICVKNMTAK